jgi:hypothetical protein
MSKSNLTDSQVDAIAFVAVIMLVVGAAVLWVAGQ